MQTNTLKKHWFWIAIVILALAAAARDNYDRFFGNRAGSKPDKYTAAEKTPSDNAAALSLLPAQGAGKNAFPRLEEANIRAFLQRFGKVTSGEQKKFGIPASALLALAYLNSFAGERAPAREANNYFALPCSNDWDGPAATIDERCYRKYSSPWESFRDFSIYLSTRDWCGDARKSAGRDGKAWAKAFAKHGITDVPNAETEMLKVIETYGLLELDRGF